MGNPETTSSQRVHKVTGISYEKIIYGFGGKDVLAASGGRYDAEAIAMAEANAVCQHGVAIFHIIEESQYSIADTSAPKCYKLTAHIVCADLSKLKQSITPAPVIQTQPSHGKIPAGEDAKRKPLPSHRTSKDYL